MKQIAMAFVKAKREFGPALKDKTNPAFRSRYADLGACIDAVEDALLNNGIAMYQETSEDATGVTVETIFLHETGESLRCGKLHVPAAKQDPQGYGSALTYSRRYSLMTACGIAPEDDDGNAATRRPQPDVAAILRGISGSTTVDVLKSNFEAAIQMLESNHHPAVTKAKNTRYKELTAQKETA
ncbi:ERF family protein [Rhodoferax koreense]|nr:ERF family protein [Rhodoferax koreense]